MQTMLLIIAAVLAVALVFIKLSAPKNQPKEARPLFRSEKTPLTTWGMIWRIAVVLLCLWVLFR